MSPAQHGRRPAGTTRQASLSPRQEGNPRSQGKEPLTRVAALHAQQAKQARQARRKRFVIGGAAAVGVTALVLGGGWLLQGQRPPTAAGASVTAAGSAVTGGSDPTPTTYTNLARGHVSGTVAYVQTPPAGGDHAGVWVNCGIYDKPVPNEAAVHSLEHGAIWITYRPDLPADQVSALRTAVRGQPYGLLSPYADLPAPIVATVWGTQLRLQSATDTHLTSFIAKYADGATAPEPRGECTGGIGSPTN